jgi:RNA polymerase sigma factor (sigma-70 family)
MNDVMSRRPDPDPPPEDFETFFGRELPRAVRLAWLLTRSATTAEDVAQDAMVAVHRRFEQLDSPSAYLTRVIVNGCGRSRRAAANQLRLVQQLSASSTGVAGAKDDYLLDAIETLPYRQRVVVVLRYWCDWSEVEIAAALACRPGTVKSLASRALTRLRTELPS